MRRSLIGHRARGEMRHMCHPQKTLLQHFCPCQSKEDRSANFTGTEGQSANNSAHHLPQSHAVPRPRAVTLRPSHTAQNHCSPRRSNPTRTTTHRIPRSPNPKSNHLQINQSRSYPPRPTRIHPSRSRPTPPSARTSARAHTPQMRIPRCGPGPLSPRLLRRRP